jgi:hypothetical protein
MWAFFWFGDSWQSRISFRIAAHSRRRRLSTFSSIPCVTWNREVNFSGGAEIRRAKCLPSQLTQFFSGG